MKRTKSGTLRQIAQDLHDEDGRGVGYLYHALLASSRALGLYEHGRAYSGDEATRLVAMAHKIFPKR